MRHSLSHARRQKPSPLSPEPTVVVRPARQICGNSKYICYNAAPFPVQLDMHCAPTKVLCQFCGNRTPTTVPRHSALKPLEVLQIFAVPFFGGHSVFPRVEDSILGKVEVALSPQYCKFCFSSHEIVLSLHRQLGKLRARACPGCALSTLLCHWPPPFRVHAEVCA